jgi:hypothetical protein
LPGRQGPNIITCKCNGTGRPRNQRKNKNTSKSLPKYFPAGLGQNQKISQTIGKTNFPCAAAKNAPETSYQIRHMLANTLRPSASVSQAEALATQLAASWSATAAKKTHRE